MGDVKKNIPSQGDLFNQPEPKKSTINTIQLTAHVERLCVNQIKHRDIWSYDEDNLYPNKVRAIWQRSPSARSASTVYSEFIAGEGFDFNDVVINEEENLTAWKLIRFVCDEMSIFNGFAIHVNYNIFGEKTSFNLVPYELCRVSLDEKKIYVKKDWGRTFGDKEEYFIYNPDNVKAEIAEVGFDKYKGQILYFKNTTRSVYTTAKCDPVLDDMQLEHEIGVYNLMNIQNNYPLSAIIKVRKGFDQKSVLEAQLNLNRAKGAKNAGKAIVIEDVPLDSNSNNKMIESIGRDNIDGLFKFQKESARDDIFAVYNQPMILSGIAKSGMFNQDQFQDAFEYYNSKTEIIRKDIEKEMQFLLSNTIYDIPENFEIRSKQLIRNERNIINNDNEPS